MLEGKRDRRRRVSGKRTELAGMDLKQNKLFNVANVYEKIDPS